MTSDEQAIVVENVSKMYHKHAGRGTLLSMIPGFGSRESDAFWALKDVSFEVRRGECLGIIGPNGAGKSTILKILSRISSPTRGSYRVNGRLSSLIEVGAGFHPELTGRENVYLNAAVLGMGKKEIERKFNDIVNFAELWDFIDMPVKRYSSGMYVRLGFSVAAHVSPEVLLIDEVLAVGDERFRSKSIDRLRWLRTQDVAVVFVSHSMPQIRKFCDRVAFLQHGRLLALGDPEEVCGQYLVSSGVAGGDYGAVRSSPDAFVLNRAEIGNNRGGKPPVFQLGDDIVVDFCFQLLKPANHLVIACVLYASSGEYLSACDTEFDSMAFSPVDPGEVSGSLYLRRPSLAGGGFVVVLVLKDGEHFLHRAPVGAFTMTGTGDKLGLIHLDHEWKINRVRTSGGHL